MLARLKDRWVLCAVVCVFVALKMPYLSYPYYWDESWPYASAIRAMHDHGLSLLPNAIDADLSRGHPLLLHVLAAGWMKVFGSSHIAMHAFALLVSVVFLVVIYEAGLRLFNQRVAVLALLLTASQEIFFVQSSALLPEVMVGLFCFLSLYCYAREKYICTAVFLTLLFYTKESGLMMGFVLGIDAWITVFNKNADRKTALGRLLAVAVPCVLIGAYFLLQKHQRGWYIFPFHTETIERTWKMYWYKLRMSPIRDVVYTHSKYYYFILLAILAIVAAIKNKKLQFLAYLLPFVICFYFVDDMRAGRILPPIPFFTLFILAWLWCAYVMSRMFSQLAQRRFVLLGACFVLAYWCFSAGNYYTYRYMIAAIVPMLFMVAILLDAFISNIYRWLYPVALVCIGAVSWYAISTNTGYGDTDLGAYKAMDVQLATVDYMEEHDLYDKHIATGSYLEQLHLTDAATGFLKYGKRFQHVKWAIDDTTDIIIFNNIENDYRYKDRSTWQHFKLAYRYQKDTVWSEVYMR